MGESCINGEGGAGYRHLDAVELPDRSTVWGVAYRPEHYRRQQIPDFGLYLDPAWQPPWPHAHVDWPDFGLPSDDAAFRGLLDELLDRARSGAAVEVGCLGGHGRTGTALACLAVLTGVEQDPIEWVRSAYCPLAVETDEQEAYVRAYRSGP